MNMRIFSILGLCFIRFTTLFSGGSPDPSANQTDTVSPVEDESVLPFTIDIEEADFSLPSGIQSFCSGTHEGKWLLIAGRKNGPFNTYNNFSSPQQNTTVYVVDPQQEIVYSKSLSDPTSGLIQAQIDLLSVTAAQFYQDNLGTLYIAGGYGIDTASASYTTKMSLSAIYIPGLMHWVMDPSQGETAAQHIHQKITNPIFQITGGYMAEEGSTLLVFGQDAEGAYTGTSNNGYSQQVRRLTITDDPIFPDIGIFHVVKFEDPFPTNPNSDFARRELNVIPTIKSGSNNGFVALSGIFTAAGGIWTVPVEISLEGFPTEADPSDPNTFKQGMNNYVCPTLNMFSFGSGNMYSVLFGGRSYGYFQNGIFVTDSRIPFINQVTTIQIDGKDNYTQYLMNAQYPAIQQGSGSSPLYFGTAAQFIPVVGVQKFNNGVVNFDALSGGPEVVGYIVGGIASTVQNPTITFIQTFASPYIFKVTLTRK